MSGRRELAIAVVALALGAAGCTSSLLPAEGTEVPGAAATLTRSIRTPIPTPDRVAAVPSPSPSPVRSPSPRPDATSAAFDDEDVADVIAQLEAALRTPSLPGIEDLLFDQVAMSTPQGGTVLEREAAADWLRDHAGPNLHIGTVERGTLTVMLQVATEGWPVRAPLTTGHLNLTLRRYDANGRPNDESGAWKIDVIDVE